MRYLYSFFSLLFLSLAIPGFTQTVKKGLAFAEDFQQLPQFKKGVQTYQYSSTDPAEDQFNDYFHWLYNEKDSLAVLADIKGPGTIYRFWSTGNTGDTNRVKIYIDGKQAPAIDETFNDFHDHKPLRDRPQVGAGGEKYLAWWSYMPISFRESIKIVREGNFRPFYNITYHTYTDTQAVRSWNGKEDYRKMEANWNNPSRDPKPTAGNTSKKSWLQLKPGQASDIFKHTGSGYIAAIRINNYLPDKNLRIKMYWDQETVPSVDAPLKWFFGSVDNGGDLQALGIGTVKNNGYCYFPMPFWKNARIELVNQSDTSTGLMDITVEYNRKAFSENNSGYFHTKANETDKPGGKYTCLQTRGRGHVIGMAKRMPKGGHACEADEVFYIDDRRFPDIYGTGEEDYSNCAWWKNSYNSYPTHGAIGNDCYYRLHFPDMLVYEQSINMQFESWQDYYIASVVWYYEKDQPGTVLTDSLDILDSNSEKEHGYTVKGQVWSGEKTGEYPGKRIHREEIKDAGRSFAGATEFKIKIHAQNKGVRLRVRSEHINRQGVNVFVDGKLVSERPWIIVKNNYDALWVDSDFELPEKYTKGKQQVTIRLEKIKGYNDWTEYAYQVYSYLF